MKKLIKSIAVLAVVILIATNVYASDYKIVDYKVEANVEKNGNIAVTEYIKYHFSESMNGLFRNVLYKYNFKDQKDNMEATSKRYQASNISNIEVYTSDMSFDNMKKSFEKKESVLSNGMNNAHSVTQEIQNGYRKNIKVYSPVSSDKYKYVKYNYTIENVTIMYNDYSEFYWNFIGSDWETDINNFNLKINFEDNIEIKAYPHTYADIKDIQIGPNYISLASDGNIFEGTALDIRAVFPSSYMSGSSKRINENYNMEELIRIENEMTHQRENYDTSMTMFFLIGACAIFFTVIVICKIPKNKFVKTINKVEHNPNLMENYSLGDYSCLSNKYFGYSNTNLLLATILDLVNKKYIKMESLKKVGKFKDTYEYFVTVDETKDFRKLNDYEKNILNYIFNEKLSDEITIDEFNGKRYELNERFKELSKNYKLGNEFRKKYTNMDSIKTKEFYDTTPSKIWKTFWVGMSIIIIILLINIFFIYPIIDKIPVISVSAFIVIFYLIISSLIISAKGLNIKSEYSDEHNQLLGLRKYLRDYSLIKEKYPIELILWERYLVFATMFGIADKVAKEFKEELLAKGYDEDYIYSYYPIVYVGIHSSTYTSYAASSTGSSSSGGYSGGGGGGGGRRRRRRRCVLKPQKCINNINM